MDSELLLEKAKQLAEYLGIDVKSIELPEDDDIYSYFHTAKGSFQIVTEDEADNMFRESVENLVDELGIKAFTRDFQEEIIYNYLNNQQLFGYVSEEIGAYINGLDENEFKAELVRYSLVDEGAIGFSEDMENEMWDKLAQTMIDKIDAKDGYVDYLIDELGKDGMIELVENNPSLLAMDKIVAACRDRDGYGSFLACDNTTISTEDFYAFKLRVDDERSASFLKTLRGRETERE